MNWPFHYTPYIWPSVTAVVFLIALSAYGWHQRSVPGTVPFAAACIFATLWGIGILLENAAVDVAAKFMWLKFQGLWQLPTVTAVLCFVLEYAYPGRWLTSRNLALLSVVPLVACFLILLGKPYESVISAGYVYADDFIRPVYNPGYWIFTGYGYLLTLLNFAVFVWLAMHSPQQRLAAILMTMGQLLAWFFYLADLWGGDMAPHIRALFPPFIFPFGLSAVALFAFHIFDPMPLAGQAAIEQLHAGMLVLDPHGRVVSLNPSAERTLGVSASQAKQQPIKALLPAYPDADAADGTETEIMLSQEKGGESRRYVLATSPLKDWRGLDLGRLVLMREITEQRRAQTQLMEQARALAALQERERVARELHDDLGQVLGYVKMQTQVACDHLRGGQAAAASDDLERLMAAIQDAHGDIREYILGSSSAKSAELGFLPTLREYLYRFSDAYGIRTELTAPPAFSEGVLEPLVRVQLLRIIQEALTNARKHAHATSVQVRVLLEDGQARIQVEDDGVGFNTDILERRQRQQFGLAFIGDRAHEVGGSVEIDSAPGLGTRMTITVPLSLRSAATA